MSQQFDLNPQVFTNLAMTQLPAIDFYQYALNQIPQVYRNAPNFLTVLQSISNVKQNIYNIIRSLVNVMNLNNIAGGDITSIPSGVYLKMLSQIFGAPYIASDEDLTIINSIQNVVVQANSRGLTSDFFSYFNYNALDGFFTNNNVIENGNATIYFNVPVPVIIDPNIPNPFTIFQTNMKKIKAGGIEIIINPSNVPFFDPGSLPTDIPPFETQPGNAGFGVFITSGDTVNGGFYKSV